MKAIFKKLKKKGSAGLFLYLLLFFIFFQIKTVYGGDSGDFLSAAAVWGIPHPPGYPLYSFLAASLHNLFTFTTPAWRVAFLSTIPATLGIYFLYKALKLMFSTKIGIIVSLFLAVTYPFWLYSELTEVFSLNNFFIIFLTYLIVKAVKKNTINLSLFFLVLGLSFSHHHTVLFLMPAVFYIFKTQKIFRKIRLSNFLFFFLGLLPHLYLPLAALKNPPVNWGNPVNFKNFFDLILRRAYGTFQANQGILRDFKGRFFNILAFFRFLLEDFSFLGIVLIFLGLTAFLTIKNKKDKDLFFYFLIALLSYVFFIFYAAFNIFGDFTVATFERFLIVPYIFFSIFVAYGIDFVIKKIKNLSSIRNKYLIIAIFSLSLFLLFPVFQFIKNYRKIYILKNDFTAERFAKDILDSIFNRGVIFTRTDTSHFNTQYVYYSLGYKNNEVKYINVFMLPADYYQSFLKNEYTSLAINPQNLENYDENVFLQDNYAQTPIYTIPFDTKEGYKIIPYGLVGRYYKEDEVVNVAQVININDNLWKNYQNPLSGSLSVYKNLFLSDVVHYYQEAAKNMGEFLIENEFFEKAEEYLLKSKEFGIEDPELELLLGRVYLNQEKCLQAETQFLKVKEVLPNSPFPDAYLRQVYLNCFKDEQKAQDFLNSCFEKENESLIKLEDL
jgi:hypothetical protein